VNIAKQRSFIDLANALAVQLLRLADEMDCLDCDGLAVLSGILRDSAYRIRIKASEEWERIERDVRNT